MTEFFLKLAAVLSAAVIAVVYVYWGPQTVSVQRGYEGVGMDHVYNRVVLGETAMANEVPPGIPMIPDDDGPRAAEVYENVQVLGNLSSAQFVRLMATMTQWVSPEQGCNYCHNPNNMASDEVYTKHVARRMLQMTQHINSKWKKHVQNTGVTCWTCHRGQPVPKYIWFEEPLNKYAYRLVGNPAEQNAPGDNVTLSSLPNDPFTPFLDQDKNIRVIGKTALPTGNRASIKQMEWTYGLMIHMSNALGVNCTYCHNSRSFAEWAQSPPARTTAWYGIRMVRDINGAYTKPLLKYYPDNRKGPKGDAPKANCQTCHQGAYKPLLGVAMVKDYPSLQASTMYVPPDRDKDGVADAKDKCPDVPGDRPEGCPPDADGDGVFDADDQCMEEPETKNGYQDADGCPDEVPAAVKRFTGAIRGIYFATGSARIRRSSFRVLNSAVRVLTEYPDLKMEIGGHTDDRGSAETNTKLSLERAQAVKDYFVGKGITEERLTATGFGSSKPKASNATAAGRRSNRRIEFTLIN